ncbi:MAG: protease inhibitor I42 family protein [Deltaproteobacteria bacterium]|nr:protease inhibitor I42 family protein [Deltaproteobacteria bacterium]
MTVSNLSGIRAQGPTLSPTSAAAVPSVKLGENDNGKTVYVPKGQNVVVELPANATTGYQWDVTRTNRSFGYPSQIEYIPSSGAGEPGRVGSGGTTRLTWSTASPFIGEGGPHNVLLSYQPPLASNASRTFEFSVVVTPAQVLRPDRPTPGTPGSVSGSVKEWVGWGPQGFNVKSGDRTTFVPMSALTERQVALFRSAQSYQIPVAVSGSYDESGYLVPGENGVELAICKAPPGRRDLGVA